MTVNIVSKYFFNLEKSRAKNKQMIATKRQDGTITRRPEEILEAQSKFYAKLYTKNTNIRFDFKNISAPKAN